MTTKALTDKEIELAASHAAETTRLIGVQEQARRELAAKQTAEFKKLWEELKIPDDPDEGDLKNLVRQFLPFIMGMFGETPLPNFNGQVPTPPIDAVPGVPVVIPAPNGDKPTTLSQTLAFPMTGGTIPPMMHPEAPPRAPMPGTGTHPGCTVAQPCEKHGGAAAGIPSIRGGAAPTAAGTSPAIAAEPTHYDGRPLLDPTTVCTIYKPCKECVDISRRPTARTGV